MTPAEIRTRADVSALERLSRRIETPCGDGRMVWRVWGEGAPVVLIHGGSGNWTHWVRNIVPLIDMGRAVYAADLPGCGESDRPPFGEDGDVLPPWIEQGAQILFGDGAFDLVGFSFGAMVSGFYAAQYADRVRKLVLVGAPALSPVPGPKVGLKEWLRLPEGPEREAAFRHNLRALMVARDATVDELSLGLYADALRQDRLTKRRIAGTDILLRTMPEIHCPMWAIWGAEDALYRTRFEVVEPALRRSPGYRDWTKIADAGHWAQFEQSQRFNALLASILRG